MEPILTMPWGKDDSGRYRPIFLHENNWHTYDCIYFVQVEDLRSEDSRIFILFTLSSFFPLQQYTETVFLNF